MKTSQNFMFSMGGYRSFLIAAALCGASAAAADTDSDYYIGVEYLESDGTQYIDTGIVADDNYGFTLDFVATKDDLSNQNFCGSRESSGDSRLIVGANKANVYIGWNTLVIPSTANVNCSTRQTASLNYLNSRTVSYSSQTVQNISTLVTQSGNFFLFAGNYPYQSGSAQIVSGYCKIYSFSMSRGSEVVSHMVPVLRGSDSTPGLYDTVRDVFLQNAGSGTFTYGAETGVVYGEVTFVASSIPSQTVSSFAELFAGVEPSVTVSNLTTETELVLGTDYTVSYSGNTAIGTAYAVITGMGVYDGKTVVVPFAITAFAALPSGYTKVDYIASSGAQYIDTGVVPSSTTRVICDFRLTVMPSDRVRSGWASTGNKEAFWFGTDNDHANFSASVCGNSVQANTGVPVDTGRHTFDISASAIKFDSTTVANPGAAFTDAASGKTMYLFASRQGWNPSIGTYCKMALYSCKIYSGDTPVRDFVPAVRDSDGAVGLYDTVSGDFFTNLGTGAFTSGTVNRFAISPIANCYVSPDELAGGVEPEVRVYDEATSSWLVLDRDYTVSYQDNTSRGAAKAVATGKGDYAGESAEVSFVIVCGKMVTADYSLSADEDWTNYDFVSIASGVTIDLNGHNMTISGLVGSGTVTDSVGGGELHCAIPASYLGDYQAAITNVTLKGKLTLVKEGPGVLTAIKEGQTYTGGTVVNAGTLKYGCGNKWAANAHPFGQISDTDQGHITINAGGVLDPGGAYAWGHHTLIINGGMISNTVAGSDMTYGIFNPKTTVNGDFTFATLENYAWTVPELDGHTIHLRVKSSTMLWIGCGTQRVQPGRIVCKGGGILRTFSQGAFLNSIDIEVQSAAFDLLSGPLTVHDYSTRYPSDYGWGSAALNVLGTFAPAAGAYFYGPTMQDGSAIDLSALTGAWNSTSPLTAGGNATTKFAAGATVTVILGERKCKVGDKVISWTTTPDSTVSFTSRRATFESRSDGLYITEWKGSGLFIFVR